LQLLVHRNNDQLDAVARDLESLHEVVSRILCGIGAHPIDTGNGVLTVTASAGFVPLPFAELPESEFGWERAVQLADNALYLSKTRGRNQAFGVLGLTRPYAEIAQHFEEDFARALDAQWFTLMPVAGPVRGATA
jgi:hypothetical protein